ncbi:MAG: hypothetical protein M3Z59_07685, partial [Bombella apis]|nr:hypothetical protein [Bombella apis]
RMTECEESLRIIGQIMASFGQERDGNVIPRTDEGLGVAEGARGDVWYHLQLEAGRITKVQIRDPALPLLAILGLVLEGQSPEQLGVMLASLGLSPAAIAL